MSSSPTSSRRKAPAVADEIEARAAAAEFHKLDVARPSAANARRRAMSKSATARIDVVVANAGIAHRVPLAALTDEKWDHTFDVDLKGIFRVVRAGRRRHDGRARRARSSALSSIMGVAYGWDEHVHYSAAKAGVVGLVRGLAVELARDGVRVNGIAPGYIRTAQLLSRGTFARAGGRRSGGRLHPDGPDRRA